eukprot:5522345-Karenia_brevis.AAC.1
MADRLAEKGGDYRHRQLWWKRPYSIGDWGQELFRRRCQGNPDMEQSTPTPCVDVNSTSLTHIKGMPAYCPGGGDMSEGGFNAESLDRVDEYGNLVIPLLKFTDAISMAGRIHGKGARLGGCKYSKDVHEMEAELRALL